MDIDNYKKYPKCFHEECNKESTHNYPGSKKVLYCNIHRKEGMIKIKYKKWFCEDCNR